MRFIYNFFIKGFAELVSKKFLLLTLTVFLAVLTTLGQIPSGYYDNASGKSGAELKTALYNIIKGHTDKGYDGLYTIYTTSDNLPSGKVWDIYSIKADGTASYWYSHTSGDRCGSYSGEGDCYNREHTFCDSWLGNASPQRSDAHHVVPTDGYVNNRRSSFPHGKVGSVSWTSSNGSKLGTSDASTGYSGTVFEPIDEFKGDFARMYFYMATRYENLIAGWVNNGSANAILAGNSYPAYKTWFKDLMLVWHNQDPVSQKELDRNNAIYAQQNNRNPFIDHPEYAQQIWGSGYVSVAFSSSATTSVQAGTAYNYNITVTGNAGATFTITAPTKPSWLTLTSTGNGKATLSGTPAEANVGANSVVLSATDGTSSATQSFSINVSSANVPLQFTSTPITSGLVGVAYSYSITVAGNSGSTFTITAPTKPSWLNLTSTGNGTATLSGTPTSGNIGSNSVVLNVSDGASNVDQSFNINITETSSGTAFVETFENMPTTSSSYSSRSWVGDNSISWTATLARTDQTITNRAICLGNSGSPQVLSQTIGGGCNQIKFKHQQKFTGSGGIITVYINDVQIGTANVTTEVQTSTFTASEAGDFVIKLVSNAASRIAIDDLEWQKPSSSTNQLPIIASVTANPTNPVTGQIINISANITDSDGTIQSAVLGWGSTASANDFSANMTANGNTFDANIPAQVDAGTVYYKITATDNSTGNSIQTGNVIVGENLLPDISNINQNPLNPKSSDNIIISADVEDPEGRLGSVTLNWGLSSNNLSNSIAMVYSSSYSATIPAQANGQTVFYKIVAVDMENNQTESSVFNFTVVDVNILPSISNVAINPTSPVTGQNMLVSSGITDTDGTIVKAMLTWGLNADASENSTEMTNNSTVYSATIPSQSQAATVYFKIHAIDNSEDTSVYSGNISVLDNQFPAISNININPANPTSTSDVVISAQVVDPEQRLNAVTLEWGLTQGNLANTITMSNSADIYSSTIPPQVGGQTVYFRIKANDQENNETLSGVLSYSVEISTGNELPVISEIVINPSSPVTGQSITISSSIVDSDGTIAKVILGWGTTSSADENTIDMNSNQSIYSAIIPSQNTVGTLYFKIAAIDNLDDTAIYTNSIIISLNNSPIISSVNQDPTVPKATENVTVTANVSDPEGRLSSVKLAWGLTELSLNNEVTMNYVSSAYSGTIPNQSEGQSVYYRITAVDSESNQSQSNIYSYTVLVENDLPVISSVEVIPTNPLTNQTINISANIIDPDGSIVKALLNWGTTSAANDNSVQMSSSDSKYSGTIPAQSQAVTIYYKILAIDNSDDTTIYSQSFAVFANQLPTISDVSQNPTNPTSADNVVISAQVTDPESRLGTVLIQWGFANNTLNYQVAMTGSSSTYTGTIPVQTTGTTVFYRVKAFDMEGNQAYSNIINYTVSAAASIGDVDGDKFAKAYPNPFYNILNIELENSGSTTIEVMDIIGKVVYREVSIDKNIPLNTSGFKPGIYIVKISNNNKTVVLRTVKR